MIHSRLNRRTFLLAAAALTASCAMQGGPSGRLRLAAGDPGGMYLAFAEVFATQLRARYPDIDVEVIPTEGTLENLARLRAGDVDMGLALADVAERDRASEPGADAPLAVARVYENYLQVIVVDADGVRDFSDLQGRRVSLGATRSGGAMSSRVLFEAAGLSDRVQMLNYRLQEALSRLAAGDIAALVWSGGVPTPAISDLDSRLPLRILDIGARAAPMSRIAGYPYIVRRVPTCGYVRPGVLSIGVPDLLLCRPDAPDGLIGAVVDVLATDGMKLVPPYVRGLQYLDTPSMIQTGVLPLHPGAVGAYRKLHG
jgi:uncharacterized protein